MRARTPVHGGRLKSATPQRIELPKPVVDCIVGATKRATDHGSQPGMLEQVDVGAILVWPAAKAEATFSAAYRMGDYDGDGEDDLLCHSTSSGSVWVDVASAGRLDGTDWNRAGDWCNAETQRLHTGDFDGDTRDDLLCHDIDSGSISVDLAGSSGEFHGIDFTSGRCWCNADMQQLHVGDFDGDGDDDLLCHDVTDGRLWVDKAEASPIFAGTDTHIRGDWCTGHYQRLHIGQLDSDGGDDLLCHDTRSGILEFDWSDAGTFDGIDRVEGPWCMGGGQRLVVGNVQGTDRDELLCFDSDDGKTYVAALTFSGTSWVNDGDDWCDGPHQRIKLGDVDGDGYDDLVCFDHMTGERWVDYAQSPDGGTQVIFDGTDWSSPADSRWCNGTAQGLH